MGGKFLQFDWLTAEVPVILIIEAFRSSFEKLLASIIVLRIVFLYTIGCDTKEKGSSLQSKKDIDGTMESHTKSAFAENFYLFETSDNIVQKR